MYAHFQCNARMVKKFSVVQESIEKAQLLFNKNKHQEAIIICNHILTNNNNRNMLDETKFATNSSNKHKVSSTKNNYMKHKKIPNAITQLVNDLINVVSFKVSISYNKP